MDNQNTQIAGGPIERSTETGPSTGSVVNRHGIAALGYMWIISAALLWSLIGPLSKLAFREGLLPLEVAFWRAVFSWCLFALHAAISGQTHVNRQDLPYLLVFGLSGVSLFYVAYQLAVQQGGAALASVLLYTAPAWVTIFARFFFDEAITRVKLLALVMTLSGVGAISLGGTSLPGSAFSGSAVFWGLVSGFCYSLYYLFGKRFSKGYSSANLFLYLLPIGIAGLLPFVTFSHKSAMAWMSLVLLSLVCTYGANSCYYASLRHLEAGRASIAATFEPVFTTIIAYFWWQERLSLMAGLGSVAVLAAVLIVVLENTGSIRK
ncbi:DMT family transporter [Desulfatirhabdium butyrativorans]|uniref:DMT family transporter n=1 Tax=Desulfatirhabdium butyrativorans TaxID=340467 RepID=UPI001B7FCA54|nr:DMT family transporter [Desulfatirhabdium butyrativorans]